MNLKALGARFVLGFLVSRASGKNKKESGVDSFLSSTIAQAEEDITGFSSDDAELMTQITKDLVRGRNSVLINGDGEVVSGNQHSTLDEIEYGVEDLSVGITRDELITEVTQLHEGVSEAYEAYVRLAELKAGVIKRD